MRIAAIIVAAGRGLRAGGDTPKQWRPIGKRSVAEHTLEIFVGHRQIDHTVLVLHPDEMEVGLAPEFDGVTRVAGGETRTASVRAGLRAARGLADFVLVHDVARPLVTSSLIDRVIDALKAHKASAPALPVTDALWRGKETLVVDTVDRSDLFRAQTPQGFHLDAILSAHEAFPGDAADDVEIARRAGIDVAIVQGDERNLKITTPGDFARAEVLMQEETTTAMDVRTGNGFDVHRFGPGDHVMLCGVEIPHGRGLQGHSDADVGLHTITDAIYGALAEGDIGRHFPPSDPKWKGAKSDQFLIHAVGCAEARGFTISNVDCTLICEEPKIGPHAAAMRDRLSEIMSLETSRISVKATTSERLGFTGRGEGIAALATVTLVSS